MRVPVATYRVQIHADFTLRDALDLVPYLSSLGISHLYLSPVFEASPGSTHGYDVVDPTRVSAAVGGMQALRELAGAAQAHGMGILLDIVPNHMAASELNPWWRDVMRHGRGSRYASFFDIAWDDEPVDRLLLPILGDDVECVVERGELGLVAEEHGPAIRYFERTFPVAVGSITEQLAKDAQGDDAAMRAAAMHAILNAQHYQLVHWRRAYTEIGYRRFFDITSLAGVRVEDPDVFNATHELVRQLVTDNVIDSLRIDHIDGLVDPVGYLDRLRAQVQADGPVYTVVEKILETGEPLPDWPVEGTTGYDFLNDVCGLFIDPVGLPLLLAQYHRMTGSEETFEDVAAEKKRFIIPWLFAAEMRRLVRMLRPIANRMYAAAQQEPPGDGCPDDGVLHTALSGITAALPVYRTYISDTEISRNDFRFLDQALQDAHDREHDRAYDQEHDTDAATVLQAIDMIGRIIVLDVPEDIRDQALQFVHVWQQLSGPVMAKGVEDTALYTFTALTSANEVGSAPGQPVVSVGEFHERMRSRAAAMPHTMNATSTHDTKRGEDVRMRINALTEVATEWTALLRSWVQRSEVFKEEAQEDAGVAVDEDVAVPDAKEEILLYQTLVGAWPAEQRAPDDDTTLPSFTDRVQQYMKKAVREAKDNSSWARPDEDYETALDSFIERLLRAPSRPKLRADINRFADRLAWHGMLASLAQTLIKITSPGVPDFYQGSELWSLVMVDPDNRGNIDFTQRAELLAQIGPTLDAPSPDAVQALFTGWRDARIKLYITAQALRFRRAHSPLFRDGEYVPVTVTGEHADRVVAYARRLGDAWCLVAVPRITQPIAPPETPPVGDVWGDTSLVLGDEMPSAWHNVMTGEETESERVADFLRSVPFGLFAPAGGTNR